MATTTDPFLACAADGDLNVGDRGIIETEAINAGYCACYSGYAPLGTGVFDGVTEACNHKVGVFCCLFFFFFFIFLLRVFLICFPAGNLLRGSFCCGRICVS